ncbi:hypothetical protein TCAL_07643 [Tigriopus californicus]|uniref:Uncharacterized protein n=1 Tax=Tigriopus californicus TaxID=6832 RepID=A0A553NNV7_TIGCA|nr:uncharacterized protein LOC131879404 [Tigriopus californicus]TRY67106.1 hypothetical protein TCAL_07643 [Tigriopus californicus]
MQRPNAEDIHKFGMDIADFKNFLSAGLSNLTCVLMTMGHLRKDFEVNEQYFMKDLWSQHAYNTDPEFQDKMIESYRQCLEFSHSVPQSILDKQPGEHWFQRQIVFFKCVKVMERKNCAKKQLSDHMAEWYG